MSETGKKIANLLATNKPAANDMTSTLKDIGGGDMFNGVKTIFDYALEEGNRNGYARGHKTGTIKGAVITLGVGGAIYVVKKVVDKVTDSKEKAQAHDEVGRRIYDAFATEDEPMNVQDTDGIDDAEKNMEGCDE